jgi:hypothetical protein
MEKNIKERKMSTEKTKTSEKDKNETWTLQERESLKSRYGCEILKHNCTLEEAKVTDVPKDAYIVTYVMDGKICYDLTRSGKKVNLFDMYYDSMGNAIRSIEWGCGKINPKLWGYEAPKTKKRK